MEKITIKLPPEVKTLISNCNAVLQIKCDYCKRKGTCKEHQLELELKKIEEEYNK